MEMSDHVTFTTPFFAVEPGEDAHTNPGIYGRALARWLAEALRARGLAVEDAIPEDWGWCITVKREPLALRVACANVDGSVTEWRVFAVAAPAHHGGRLLAPARAVPAHRPSLRAR